MKPSFVFKCLSCFTLIMSCQSYAQQQKLLPDDGKAKDSFGYSVAIDGATALVGSHRADAQNIQDSGAGYIYSLGSSGWQQQAKLIAKPAYINDTLGGNVALKQNMAMLGVRGRDEDAGAVLAFEKEDNSWSQKQLLTAPDRKAGDTFGQSIALTERFLVIGAPHSNAPSEDSGSVYVYQREESSWQFHSKLTAKDGTAGDLFGISVAIDGNTILIGADLNDQLAENAGAVYAFEFDGKQWLQQAKLVASDGADTDIFGVRVALSGDTALISARRDDVENIGKDAGSAYIFERVNGQWSQTQKLVAPDGKADDRFARGVALNKDTALISAMHHDSAGNNAGALYMFKKQLGQWRYTSKIVAQDGVAGDRFGWNIGVTEKRVIVAVPHRDDNGDASGAAYVLELVD